LFCEEACWFELLAEAIEARQAIGRQEDSPGTLRG
jgi:hypothetical protein